MRNETNGEGAPEGMRSRESFAPGLQSGAPLVAAAPAICPGIRALRCWDGGSARFGVRRR